MIFYNKSAFSTALKTAYKGVTITQERSGNDILFHMMVGSTKTEIGKYVAAADKYYLAEPLTTMQVYQEGGSGGGGGTFIGLSDTPSAYTSQTGKTVKVNAGETAIEFVDLPVKASGAEADTGTDDAKFLTSKAAKDSHNIPSVAPGTSGNVLTSDGTDWTSAAPSGGGSADGWIDADETWTYSSVDDPTGIITVAADVTAKYSAGMRIKFTNGGNTIYGIISKTPTYSAPNTTITFLHEIDPTDSLALYLMANSAITANYYSNCKVPAGFPLMPDSWSVYYLYNAGIALRINPATSGTWYNLTNCLLSVPIGAWKIGYDTYVYVKTNSAAIWVSVEASLATVNNNRGDHQLTHGLGYDAASAILSISASANKTAHINLSSKTTYYLNYMAMASTGTLNMGGGSLIHEIEIRAVCDYL